MTASNCLCTLHHQYVSRPKRVARKRSKFLKPIHAVWDLFSDYTGVSTIHGVRYLGEKDRHWFERIWWIFVFSVSLACCGTLIYDTYKKWDEIPVIVTFAEKSTPIWDIPFPAVTICPETKSKQSTLNYTHLYQLIEDNKESRISKEKMEHLRSVAKICRFNKQEILDLDSEMVTDSVYEHLRKAAPSLTELFMVCQWRNQRRRCSDIIHEVWTDEGLCFTFNILNSNELFHTDGLAENFPRIEHKYVANNTWTSEKGYVKGLLDNETYPFRVFCASDGLAISLRLVERDFDYLCGGSVQGFKLLLHSSGEAPQISKYFYRIPLDHEVIVSVKPHIMTVTDKLKAYSTAQKRQCTLQEEGNLSFYREYTQRNCELDCITQHTKKLCDCVLFYMPRDNSTKICGLKSRKCYKAVEAKLSRNSASGKGNTCDCLPACSSISYDAELSQAKYDLQATNRAMRKPFKEKKQYSLIFISFKETQFLASKRSELYGTTDFLANCGGLLGLFMGFSILSFMEITYFCTLRVLCNIRQKRQWKRKRISAQLEKLDKTNIKKF